MSVYKVRGPRVRRLAMKSPSDQMLTEEEVLFARGHFEKFDSESRGFIDTEELPSLLRQIGFYMEKERLEKYYLMFFGPGLNTMDPTLTWERFLLVFSMLMRNQLPIFRLRLISKTQEPDYIKFAQIALDDAINVFTEFDVDGSGELDQKELKVLLSCIGVKEGVDIDQFVTHQSSKLDKNSDSKIDFDEFIEYYNELMDLV